MDVLEAGFPEDNQAILSAKVLPDLRIEACFGENFGCFGSKVFIDFDYTNALR